MRVYCHAPSVPDELEPLLDLAYNLWSTADPQAQWVFRRLAPGLWDAVNHNPVRLLRCLTREELGYRARNDDIVRAAHDARNRMVRELESDGRYRHVPVRAGESEIDLDTRPAAAYFCAEFGLHESLPNYSGGLGVLAGDHVRSASDIKLPLVGVGLLYRFGYFHQRISLDDWQLEAYEPLGFHDHPLRLVETADRAPLTIEIELPDHRLAAQVWLAQVGRTRLFLLDSYIRQNRIEDREVTARLYDSDRRIRLLQEILLGVGGVRVLRALGIEPGRYHMNEGHSAFSVLERAADLIAEYDISLEEARSRLRPNTVFTTHTPVPAGNEVFRRELMEPYFAPVVERLRVSVDDFFALGRRPNGSDGNEFEMTALAIRFSEHVNGVSKKHGEVARQQWTAMWPDRPADQVPIGHVTNGVHVASWVGPEMRQLFEKHLAVDWIGRLEDREMWERVRDIPDAELWDARGHQRERLARFLLRRAQQQLIVRNAGKDALIRKITGIRSDALTIGFARRFATYKRATLLFRHAERLHRLIRDDDRPVQIVFAGKAHPADDAGKELIRKVIRYTLDPAFYGKILFIEDYDINVGRQLVQGVDVWLNNPRPPQEASGTSGMKTGPNGGLCLSTYDGWWMEAANGKNGWTIGGERDEELPPDVMDETHAARLIELLENEVVPLFWERDDDGIPHRWLERVKDAIKTVTPEFSTSRMVGEYARRYYLT